MPTIISRAFWLIGNRGEIVGKYQPEIDALVDIRPLTKAAINLAPALDPLSIPSSDTSDTSDTRPIAISVSELKPKPIAQALTPKIVEVKEE